MQAKESERPAQNGVHIDTAAILSPNDNGGYAMKTLHKEDAMLLFNDMAHALFGVFNVVRRRDLGFWPKLGRGFAIIIAGTMGGVTAIADEDCDATVVAEGSCAYEHVVSREATVADARMAAMLHTPLSIEEIDAAIADAVKKADELFKQAGGTVGADHRPNALPPDTFPDPRTCRVQLTACITRANEGHHPRVAECDIEFEEGRRPCVQSARGSTAAEREANYKLCMRPVRTNRDACTSASDGALYRAIGICQANHNCYPLPC